MIMLMHSAFSLRKNVLSTINCKWFCRRLTNIIDNWYFKRYKFLLTFSTSI